MTPTSIRTRSLSVIAIGTLAFIGIAWQVQLDGGLIQLDRHVSVWVQTHRNTWLQSFLFVLTHLHNTGEIVGVGALIGAYLGWQRRWQALSFMWISLYGGMWLNVLLKLTFARARPEFEVPLVTLQTFSFPSGHAANSTLLYLSAIVLLGVTRWRRWAIGAGCTLVALVAFSRVYLGAHYFSDVVAGICVGLVWVNVCRLLIDPSLRRVDV